VRIFFLLVFIAPFLFGLDMQTLSEKAEKKDKEFFLQLLSKTEIYEDMQKIPNNWWFFFLKYVLSDWNKRV